MYACALVFSNTYSHVQRKESSRRTDCSDPVNWNIRFLIGKLWRTWTIRLPPVGVLFYSAQAKHWNKIYLPASSSNASGRIPGILSTRPASRSSLYTVSRTSRVYAATSLFLTHTIELANNLISHGRNAALLRITHRIISVHMLETHIYYTQLL